MAATTSITSPPRYLLHAESLLIIGLVAHDRTETGGFDEHRVGLDHLSFNVASAEELASWVDVLDERGIDHSPIATGTCGMSWSSAIPTTSSSSCST